MPSVNPNVAQGIKAAQGSQAAITVADGKAQELRDGKQKPRMAGDRYEKFEAPPSTVGSVPLATSEIGATTTAKSLNWIHANPKLPNLNVPALTHWFGNVQRFAGPVGSAIFTGWGAFQTRKLFKDPTAPTYAKAGMATATGLGAVALGGAVPLALSTFGKLSLSTAAASTLGRVVGGAGAGAGAAVNVIDTIATFRNKDATAGQKAFSLLGSVSAVGATAAFALGAATGPVGIALIAGSIAFPLLKNWLGKSKAANSVFGAIGSGIKKLFGG